MQEFFNRIFFLIKNYIVGKIFLLKIDEYILQVLYFIKIIKKNSGHPVRLTRELHLPGEIVSLPTFLIAMSVPKYFNMYIMFHKVIIDYQYLYFKSYLISLYCLGLYSIIFFAAL